MGALGGLTGTGGGAAGTGFGGPTMASQQGNNNMQQAYQQLQQVASGQGPDPAMAAYNQNINNLAKQQSGAISSVQGISPALAARMISQQGSGAMQNAAAAGSTMQAQQQLGAMGQMGQIGAAQQGLANQMQLGVNSTNAGLAQQTMAGQQGLLGGAMNGLGSAAGLFGAGGGEVQKMADGGSALDFGRPQSSLGQYMFGSGPSNPGVVQPTQPWGGKSNGKPTAPAPENAGQGPTVANAANLTPDLPYSSAAPMSQQYGLSSAPGFASGGQMDFRSGGNVKAQVPAQRAVKSGNSYANDKIPAVLSEGEVVIPRNVMQSSNPPEAAMRFVAAVMAKKGKR